MTPKTKQHWSSNEANKQGNGTQIRAQFRLRQFYGDLSESILWQETTCTTSPSTSRQSDLTRRRGLGFTSSPLFVIQRFGCGDTPSPGIIGREWLNQVFIARLYFGVRHCERVIGADKARSNISIHGNICSFCMTWRILFVGSSTLRGSLGHLTEI